jgi:uncharacterized protein YcfL
MKINKIVSLTLVVILSSFFLSACGKKTTTTTNSVTPVAKTLEISDNNKPVISLIPRADGHELKLKINNIPSNITQIEYELLYSAQDNGLEMEKGVGDTVKITSKDVEKDLLLGTASCTNGCKYAYDKGVNGGTLSLTFSTADNQSAVYETSFVLKTSADVKKDGGFSLPLEKFTVKASTTTASDYFIVIKNFKSYYSIFSNGTGTGKVSSISPEGVTKENKTTITGDYLIN